MFHRERLLLVAMLAATFCGCGGGGGGGDSSGGTGLTAAPTIVATLAAFPANAVPPGATRSGQNAAASVQVSDASGNAVTTATVSVNGVTLSYNTADAQFEGELTVSPGQTVMFQVDVNGQGYSAAMHNFSAYPTITAPVANVYWAVSADNVVSWNGTPPSSSAQYLIGVLDAIGNLVWPVGGPFLAVPTSTTTTTIPANNLSAGRRMVLVGIADGVAFPGAASGSEAVIAGFTYSPVTVTWAAAPVSVQVTPDSMSVGLGGTTHLAAMATMSDNSVVDVTAQATWSSGDTSIASVDATGTVRGVAGGTTSVTAMYGGFSSTAQVVVFVPNPSPTPPLSQSVTFQVDYAHSGHATVGGSGPTFPPGAHWSVTLSGSTISYPIIADGRVFVATDATPAGSSYGNTLYALDEQTGAILWGPTPVPTSYGAFMALAYDHGTLFTVNTDGDLASVDPATGSQIWAVQTAGNFVDSAPTAVNGLVYVTGNNGLQSFDEATGATLFTQYVGADHSAPTVSPDGVFQSNPCWAEKYDLYSGVTLWSLKEPCGGGGGKTTVYANGLLYVRDIYDAGTNDWTNLTVDAATGTPVGAFPAGTVPAIDTTTGYFVGYGQLTALNLTSGNTKWTFPGDGQLVSAPIVIDGYVVTGSTSGTVYAVNSSGQQVWSAAAGGQLMEPDERSAGVLTGFGVGDGYLVVPAGNVLNGWRLVP